MGGIARQLIGKATALVGLLVLAVAGALVVDIQQMLSPTLVVTPCEDRNSHWMARDSQTSCVWEKALRQQDSGQEGGASSTTVQIDVKERKRLLEASVAVTLPANGPVADAVRRGEAARRPDEFVYEVVGSIAFANVYVAWGAPTMRPGGDGEVVVALTGSPAPYGWGGMRSAAAVKVEVSPARYPTNLAVTATERVVIASRMPRAGTKVDGTKLTARLPGDGKLWTVTLGSSQPRADIVDTALTTPAWWKRAEPVGQAVVTGWGACASMLLGAFPWMLLLLAGHAKAFRPLNRRPQWGRYVRLTGLVLAVHLSVAVVLTAQFDYPVQLAFNADGAFFQFADSWLPWSPDRNVGVDGMTVLLLTAAGTLLPSAIRRTRPALLAPKRAWITSMWGLPWLILLLGCAVLVATAGPFPSGLAETAVGALTLYGGTLAALAVLTGLARPLLRVIRAPDGPPPPPLGNLVICAVVVAGLATYHHYFGYIPWALRWVLLLLAGATALLCLASLWFQTVTGRPLGRRNLIGLAPAALALTVPWYQADYSYTGWELFVSFAQGVDGLLALLLVTAGVLTLRRIGRGPVASMAQLQGHRAIGVAVAVIVLSNAYSFYRVPTLWGLLAAVIGGLFLLPSGQVARAAAVVSQDAASHRRALGGTIMAGAARRQLHVARRTSREKTAEEGGSLAAQQRVIRRLELVAWRDRDAATGGSSPTTRERALGALASRSPWHRGIWGARWGLVFGLPWTAFDLAGTASLTHGDPYALLTVVGTLLPTALQWTGVGLFFGYFFPLLGGQSGLTKAMRLTTAAVALTVLETALVAHTGSTWPTTTLAVAQLLAFCMSLGLLADRDSLARARYPWARLADVHNLGSLTAWASSVAAALAAAVAALVLAGVQPFVTNLVEPPATSPQPKPPASTASP
ncbi:hypothetical protein AB0M28_20620 [Streptomyces sp. NPDC051940]|uniref:hypothetical protein n=1 Tax=Streptomyces sp. NPDC051940 TaxID=3155675 RepID=UPI00342B07C9